MLNKSLIIKTTSCLLLYFFLSLIPSAKAQHEEKSLWTPASEYNKKRMLFASYSLAGAYSLSMAGLYQLWYKDQELTKFHFFNDNNEWLQVDKAGHAGSAYYLGKWSMGVFRWAGMNSSQSAWRGGMIGLAFLSTIEIFDGFSEAWGFSSGDMAANIAGTGLLISQQLLWEEQRITFKVSFHTTPYAQHRPDQLGTNLPERIFKDYNGQTIWLSANIFSFLPHNSRFPKWLNIAAGYGAEGMTGARANVLSYNDQPLPVFSRYRQFYIAPDIDLTKIKTRSALLKSIFNTFGLLKFPAPAIEFNRIDKIKIHALYF